MGRRHSSLTGSASAASEAASRMSGRSASAALASGTVPMWRAAPGIAVVHTELPRSVGPRWVRRRQVPILTPIPTTAPLAAITPTRLATEAPRAQTLLVDRRLHRGRRSRRRRDREREPDVPAFWSMLGCEFL